MAGICFQNVFGPHGLSPEPPVSWGCEDDRGILQELSLSINSKALEAYNKQRYRILDHDPEQCCNIHNPGSMQCCPIVPILMLI